MIRSVISSLMGLLRGFTHQDDGQSIIEVAVAAPLMLLLLVGTFEVGRYAYDGIEVGNAARAGVQYAAQNGTTNSSGITGAVIADGNDLSLLNTDVTSSSYCTCDSSQGSPLSSCSTFSSCASNDRVDTFIKVIVSKQFFPLIQYPGLPASLTIAHTATQEVSP